MTLQEVNLVLAGLNGEQVGTREVFASLINKFRNKTSEYREFFKEVPGLNSPAIIFKEPDNNTGQESMTGKNKHHMFTTAS